MYISCVSPAWLWWLWSVAFTLRLNTGKKMQGICFPFQSHWAYSLLSFSSPLEHLPSIKFLSLNLISLTHTLKYDIFQFISHISLFPPLSFLLFYFCLSLWLPPLLNPRWAVSLYIQKPFPLPGYNRQLFSVWNNNDCHHGYPPIPRALSGPLRVLKGAIIWWHQRQVTAEKSKARGIRPEPFIRQVETGSGSPCSVQLAWRLRATVTCMYTHSHSARILWNATGKTHSSSVIDNGRHRRMLLQHKQLHNHNKQLPA